MMLQAPLVMLDEPFTGIDRSDQSRTNGFDPRDAPAGTDHPGGAA